MSLRDDALKAFGALPSERVTAGGLEFEVRGLSVKVANDLYARITVRKGGEVEVDRERWNVEWVIACTFDPKTGERVFETADRDTLLGSAAFPIQALATAATRLSGYGSDDTDAARELKSESA